MQLLYLFLRFKWLCYVLTVECLQTDVEAHLQLLQFLSHFFISVNVMILSDAFVSVSLVVENAVNRTKVMLCMNKSQHEFTLFR